MIFVILSFFNNLNVRECGLSWSLKAKGIDADEPIGVTGRAQAKRYNAQDFVQWVDTKTAGPARN